MLLTIATEHRPATDLSFLLHKHPDRFQSFDLSFGQAHVFYPQATDENCTAALLLDVDSVGLVRSSHRNQNFQLAQYVNDRPYAASSFMSVAIAQVFGSALGGRCKDRPELVSVPQQLTACLEVLPVRGGEDFLTRIFQPLGYEVEAIRHPLDEKFPQWGPSPYYSIKLSGHKTLSELLTHLYVLIPVFDNEKHYFVGEDELDKLMAKGAQWLATHPEKEEISRRYLKFQSGLYRQAISRLEDGDLETENQDAAQNQQEETLEEKLSLNDQRHATVMSALRASGARSVMDLGCSEGKLLRSILSDSQFERIVGLDVSIRSLEIA